MSVRRNCAGHTASSVQPACSICSMQPLAPACPSRRFCDVAVNLYDTHPRVSPSVASQILYSYLAKQVTILPSPLSLFSNTTSPQHPILASTVLFLFAQGTVISARKMIIDSGKKKKIKYIAVPLDRRISAYPASFMR